MEPIILASGSLRRQEYFRLMGLPFNIIPAQIDETYSPEMSPREVTAELAARKVSRIIEMLQGRTAPWICGADTVISLEGAIFGKPQDREHARTMLSQLKGRTHQVITSIALFNGGTRILDCRPAESAVTFAPLTEHEIEWYLNTGEWQGVAGAYRIQGLGSCLIANIEGSYSGIVGLPIREFYVMLLENGYPYGAA